MTITELRQHEEYALCMKKIRGYSKGFRFTIPYNRMTVGQANAMKIVMEDAVTEGLVESVGVEYGFAPNPKNGLIQAAEIFVKVAEAVK